MLLITRYKSIHHQAITPYQLPRLFAIHQKRKPNRKRRLKRRHVTSDRKLETPKVRDILNKKVIALTPDFTILDAIQALNKYRISTAPVVNALNEVIGYLSEGDCIKSVTNSLYYDQSMGKNIDTIMSTKVAYAEEEWDIFELEVFFESRCLRSVPVVDSENHLVGVVTRRDVLIALVECADGRETYKKLIKTPVELNTQERISIIIERY